MEVGPVKDMFEVGDRAKLAYEEMLADATGEMYKRDDSGQLTKDIVQY